MWFALVPALRGRIRAYETQVTSRSRHVADVVLQARLANGTAEFVFESVILTVILSHRAAGPISSVARADKTSSRFARDS